jgi:hypothetical protein
MWWLSKEDLLFSGFSMIIFDESTEVDPLDALHINILEFLTLIIDVWFVLVFCLRQDPSCSQHYIGLILGDNTSALSWMAHAGRVKKPRVRRLARFLQALLTFTPVQFVLEQAHLAGTLNDTADALSRPSRAPSWASVIDLCPVDLSHCQAFRVPQELLCALRDCLASDATEVISAARMTRLLTLEPRILPDGWRASDTMTSLWS